MSDKEIIYRLPKLLLLNDYEGDWEKYIDEVYKEFSSDFLINKVMFRGKVVKVRKTPIFKGKEIGFWHATSAGNEENDRLPDLRRCERIKWIRKLIECKKREDIREWETRRGSDKRFLISLNDFSYVVVLAKRKSYYQFITAFYVEKAHRKIKLEKEWKSWKDRQKD